MSLKGPGVFERVFKKKSEREILQKIFPAFFPPRAINYQGCGHITMATGH